jgi:hypothetical protein
MITPCLARLGAQLDAAIVVVLEALTLTPTPPWPPFTPVWVHWRTRFPFGRSNIAGDTLRQYDAVARGSLAGMRLRVRDRLGSVVQLIAFSRKMQAIWLTRKLRRV